MRRKDMKIDRQEEGGSRLNGSDDGGISSSFLRLHVCTYLLPPALTADVYLPTWV
jgi:hypothetical protein